MEQPAAQVTANDVERIVRRDFPGEAVDTVLGILQDYGKTDWQRDPDRVRAAALKLANGDLGELRKQIELAKRDCRDVIAPAEYPAYAERLFDMDGLSRAERDEIIQADWKQYQHWLEKAQV